MFRKFVLATRQAAFVAFASLLYVSAFAASVNTRPVTGTKTKPHGVAESTHARKKMHSLARSHAATARSTSAHALRTSAHRTHHRYYERFYTSSFADAISDGDVTAGEDPIVRQAAIDALGNMNGTVVAIEPTSGR